MEQLDREGVMVAIVVVLAGLALIGYVLVSRWRGQVLNVRRLLVLPAMLTVVGVAQVVGLARHGYRPVDVVLITVGVAASAVLGATRGVSVAVYQRDGATWLRYRSTTLWLWLATVAVRLALTGLAHTAGATLAASGPALLLAVGTTLLGEAVVIARTAFSPQAVPWHARSQRDPASR